MNHDGVEIVSWENWANNFPFPPEVASKHWNEATDHIRICFRFAHMHKQTTNAVALSPQANYTDWATAICRRNLVPTFVDRGVSHGQRGGSLTVINLSFLDQSRYFSFKQLLIYSYKGWVDPVPDLLLLRKFGSAGNRTRTSGLAARNSDH
jgi:hypothetical protein